MLFTRQLGTGVHVDQRPDSGSRLPLSSADAYTWATAAKDAGLRVNGNSMSGDIAV